MPHCLVYGCGTNDKNKKALGFTIHRFPKDKFLRQLWALAVRRTPGPLSVICSAHFREEDIDRTSLAVVRIRENRIPSIFPPFKDDIDDDDIEENEDAGVAKKLVSPDICKNRDAVESISERDGDLQLLVDCTESAQSSLKTLWPSATELIANTHLPDKEFQGTSTECTEVEHFKCDDEASDGGGGSKVSDTESPHVQLLPQPSVSCSVASPEQPENPIDVSLQMLTGEMESANELLMNDSDVETGLFDSSGDEGAIELRCQDCNFTCKTNYELARHERTKHVVKLLQCGCCSFTCTRKLHLFRHLFFTHSPERSSSGSRFSRCFDSVSSTNAKAVFNKAINSSSKKTFGFSDIWFERKEEREKKKMRARKRGNRKAEAVFKQSTGSINKNNLITPITAKDDVNLKEYTSSTFELTVDEAVKRSGDWLSGSENELSNKLGEISGVTDDTEFYVTGGKGDLTHDYCKDIEIENVTVECGGSVTDEFIEGTTIESGANEECEQKVTDEYVDDIIIECEENVADEFVSCVITEGAFIEGSTIECGESATHEESVTIESVENGFEMDPTCQEDVVDYEEVIDGYENGETVDCGDGTTFGQEEYDEMDTKKPYFCLLCPFRAEVRKSLTQHVQTEHRTGGAFVCYLCGYSTHYKPNFHRHVTQVHFFKKKKGRHVKCLFCDYKSAGKKMMERHIAFHHKGFRPYHCKECHYVSTSAADYQEHIADSHKMDRLCCILCSFSTSETADLRNHMKECHSGVMEGNFSCPHCDHTVQELSHLKRHIKMEHQVKHMYKCSFCDHSATQSGNLKRHIQVVHKGIRNTMKCHLCPYTTTTKPVLQMHIQEKHENQYTFVCDLCSFKTSLRVQFRRHYEAVHLGRKPYACDFCDFRTAQKGHLTHHVAVIHRGEKPFACSFCLTFRTGHRCNLKSHLKAVHKMEDAESLQDGMEQCANFRMAATAAAAAVEESLQMPLVEEPLVLISDFAS